MKIEKQPLKLCTFSRVLKEKGIEDAVQAVKDINEKEGKTIFTLDIYGQVDEAYKERFKELMIVAPAYIRYGGLIPFDKSTEVLKDYYALLFPTYYSGEGFAGTLIDAWAAGLPVIASDWKYNPEIISEFHTGYIHKSNDSGDLEEKLLNAWRHSAFINHMKIECVQTAEKYLPKNAMAELISNL